MASIEFKTDKIRLFPARFPELEEVFRLKRDYSKLVDFEILAEVQCKGRSFPIPAFRLGSKDPQAPSFGLFGGVHGLERIGSQTIIAFLKGYLKRLSWDQDLQKKQNEFRLVIIPVINPAGMFYGHRSNMNGVDLMRNAPIDAESQAAFLVGGHRISRHLPWYRGKLNEPMQRESQAVANFVKEELFSSPVSMALDVHSGFGFYDRIWHPFAGSRTECFHQPEVLNLKSLLDVSFPHHVYRVEAQHQHYMSHGDLWDYLYHEHRKLNPNQIFIPWTLEMGSWKWVRKNPLQLLLYRTGAYHPIKAHRLKRIFRRHINLFEFFMSAVRNPNAWQRTEVHSS